jgi:hypothetical protein
MRQLTLNDVEQAPSLWREDAAVWSIIAGEVILQHDHPLALDADLMIHVGASRAETAAGLMDSGDLNAAGHSMIGSSIAVALAARAMTAESTPIASYASELAEALSWQAAEPHPSDMIRLADEIRAHGGSPAAGQRPTLWELAVKAGGHAVGLSAHIVRRRERRDLVDPERT